MLKTVNGKSGTELLYLSNFTNCSVVGGGGHWLHDLSSAHDWPEEHDSDALEQQVDEGDEESDRADVLEGLPSVGVLEGLAGPDLAHDEDPQDIHDNGQHAK